MDDLNTESPAETADAPLIELRSRVLDDLKTREEWLRRQAAWYAMRHDGLRRRNKPWPHAADLHFPLVDSVIERLKPFYFNQLFATETLASFISTKRELDAFTSDAGYWFDYKLKQTTNLETEILVGIDRMLMAGMVVVKVYWQAGDGRLEAAGGEDQGEDSTMGAEQEDEEDEEDEAGPAASSLQPPARPQGGLRFDAVDPSRVIVPQWTEGLQDADRITLVHTISVEQYKRDERFPNKSEEFIRSIKGKGGTQDGRNLTEEELKVRREGLTYASSDEEIVYWEVWENTSAGWIVHFLSPLQAETELRPSMRNPFIHGKAPLVRFDVEIKDKGHYASRGVPERIGGFETAICKTWDEKTDYMTLCNRPLFTSASPIPNAGNLRLIPGQIIPGGLTAVQMPPPPMSFEEEMQAQRSAAEQLIGMPDFGQGQDQNTNEPRTATEVQHISALMNVSVDLRARTFRKSLGDLYDLAWQTLLQYDEDTQFFVGNDVRDLDAAALAALQNDPKALRIQPNGSADSWNRQGQLQKAIARKQLLGQSPWINQPELDKSILELDDPRLVKRLFVDPQRKQRDEYSDEATKIPALMLGFPLPPEGGQDYATRIKCLVDFLHQRAVTGAPADPVAIQTIQGRISALLQALEQSNPQQAAQVKEALATMGEAHAGAAAGQAAGGRLQAGGSDLRPPASRLQPELLQKTPHAGGHVAGPVAVGPFAPPSSSNQ